MSPTLDEQVKCIRHSAATSRLDHVQVVLVSGDEAFELLDRVSSSDLYLRDGQLLHTLFLDAEARPMADVLIARDDEDFLILAEGKPGFVLVEHLAGAAAPGAAVALLDLGASHSITSVDGPFSWELAAEALGPDLISLPHRTFFHTDGGWCLRLGKTGEYGYWLVLPKDRAREAHARLVEASPRFHASQASVAALDQCALENWFFCIRNALPEGVTPIELQLQWRVSYRKDYVGAEALRARRQAGAQSRSTMVASLSPLSAGDPILLEDGEIGRIYAAALSPIRGDWIALALLLRPFAYPGVKRYRVSRGGERQPVNTLAPPAINNRSLYVDPRRHTYRHFDFSQLPELVLPSQRCR